MFYIFSLTLNSNTGFFLQATSPSNFRFYKLAWGCEQISSTFISQTSHITFNKNLPQEIICQIVSYLSINDILSLCISKVFLPCFINSPWFFKKITAYFTHLLGHAYSRSRSLFILCALYPTIVNQNFYFSVNFSRLPYFKKLQSGKDTIFKVELFEDILKVWFILFQPYKQFKKNKQYYLKAIGSFSKCHKLCPCLKYRNAPFSVKCHHQFD